MIVTFAKESRVTCLVVADGKVEFEGQILSPSAAAHKVVRKIGYQCAAVSGIDY